ncbi:MAG TPA: thioredoxin family protein [Candidatus Ozemobacteraceae bacterium]
MNTILRLGLVILASIGLTLFIGKIPGFRTKRAPVVISNDGTVVGAAASASGRIAPGLPRLVDLGSVRCISCKEMEPILEEAKKLYTGKAEVEFIDIWQNKDAASAYAVRMIPTQVFFDATGKEVFRHVGVLPMGDIQKQFECMGIPVKR